jgi:hypothetical protein
MPRQEVCSSRRSQWNADYTMSVITIGGATILSVLLGITAPAYVGQEHGGEKETQPRQQQNSHEQARPAQQHAQQATQQTQSRPAQNNQQQPRAAQNRGSQQRTQQQQSRQSQSRPQKQRAGQHSQLQQRFQAQHQAQQNAWQQHRAGNWQADHRNWQQSGGYNGYRIPNDRFRGYFGEGYAFRIGGLPFMMVGGYPRFQYGGYWFSAVDPWPAYWGDNWYDNDDVYVNYVDNGYYLYDRRYPGVCVAISVSF